MKTPRQAASPTSAERTAPAGPRRCAAFRHPTQTTLVRVCVYDEPSGWLVTEERVGSATVVATLGFCRARAEAEALADGRVDELLAQRYEQLPA